MFAINLEIVAVKSKIHGRRLTYFHPLRLVFSEFNVSAKARNSHQYSK